MSNCHARDFGKCGVKGRPSSTPSSRCFNCSCITLWTRIFMAFSCSRIPNHLVRVFHSRIEDRNFGSENMRSPHPHASQCTAQGWIWSRSHRRSRAPAWGGSSSRTTREYIQTTCACLWPRIRRQTLFRRSDGWNTLLPTLSPVSVVPTGLSYTTRARHRVPCERCAVVLHG